MRLFCVVFLLLLSVVEIGPVPITPLLLLWVVIFRPPWFWHLLSDIYRRRP